MRYTSDLVHLLLLTLPAQGAATIPGTDQAAAYGLVQSNEGSSCTYTIHHDPGYPHRRYTVTTAAWGWSPTGCGGGILDNLRGQCLRSIMNWGCDRLGSSDGAVSTFDLPWIDYTGHCVEDAIWLASPHDHREEGVHCASIN